MVGVALEGERGGVLAVRQPWDLAVAEGVDEELVVVAGGLGVVLAEVHHLLDELVFFAAYGDDDLILGLEAYDGRVGVFVRDAVNFGSGPAQVVQDRGHLLGLG